jgi:hypothetical protein
LASARAQKSAGAETYANQCLSKDNISRYLLYLSIAAGELR